MGLLQGAGKDAVVEAGKVAEAVHENVGETLGNIEAALKRLLPLPLDEYELVLSVRKKVSNGGVLASV
jgi:hypothetical protein